MLVQLAMTLSTIHGWSLPVDDKASSLSPQSAITGGFDGARDRRLLSSSCDSSCRCSMCLLFVFRENV